MVRAFIPNFITLLNLASGCAGVVFSFQGDFFLASLMVFAGAVFDFFDGLAARLLKVSSPIGKELDSLADVVSFGVLPGVIVFNYLNVEFQSVTEMMVTGNLLPIIALLIPLFSAYRLAKFNVDTQQDYGFRGLPTPANAIFWASLILILNRIDFGLVTSEISNLIIAAIVLIMSILLVSDIRLFSLKFKTIEWADNKQRYIFLALSGILLSILGVNILPAIIVLYISISLLIPDRPHEVPGKD